MHVLNAHRKCALDKKTSSMPFWSSNVSVVNVKKQKQFFSPLQNHVRDKLQPIAFTLNVSLNEQKAAAQQTLQSLDDFPVLSGQQILTDKTEVQTSSHVHPSWTEALLTAPVCLSSDQLS